MLGEYIWAILQEINSIWLTISLVSILFFFFFVKVKFQKAGTLKAYGILFYAFVFYAISALSFVLLNAMDTFFRLNNDLYSNFLWFFPFAILSALTGALVGWLIYVAGEKTAKDYVFKLMNLSLLIVAPSLLYSLLIKPMRDTLALAIVPVAEKPGPKAETFDKEPIEVTPSANDTFIPATPAQLYDSLLLQLQNNHQLLVMNPRNGFSYTQEVKVQPVEQIYVSEINQHKQLAILLNTPAIQKESELIIVDSLGMLVFRKSFNNGTNRMNLGWRSGELLLLKENENGKASTGVCYQLKP